MCNTYPQLFHRINSSLVDSYILLKKIKKTFCHKHGGHRDMKPVNVCLFLGMTINMLYSLTIAIQAINDDDTEESKTSYEALTLLKYFSSLEIYFMTYIFGTKF